MPGRVTARLAALALAVLGLSTLGLAACGGSEEDEYKDAFPPLSERLVELGEEVSRSIQGAGESTDEQLAEDFGEFADQLDDVAQDMEDLEPPDELSDDHDELLDVMDEVQESLEQIAEAADEGDPDAARQATIELVQRSADLRTARGELAAAVADL